jgi:hypothetical protein
LANRAEVVRAAGVGAGFGNAAGNDILGSSRVSLSHIISIYIHIHNYYCYIFQSSNLNPFDNSNDTILSADDIIRRSVLLDTVLVSALVASSPLR